MTKQGDNRIDLAQVLRLALPKEAEILAGEVQLGRRINWMALLTEVGRVERQVEAYDIALLPPTLSEGLTAISLLALARALQVQGASGLVLFAKKRLPVSDRLVALGFVVIQVSAETTFRDTCRDITTLLTNRKAHVVERGMRLYRKLSETSREGLGLQAMADVLAQQCGKTVIIQDKRLDIRALSGQNDDVDIEQPALRDVLHNLKALPEVLRNRKAAARTRRNHWRQVIEADGEFIRLVSPIISGDRARGYLSLIGPANSFDALDTVIVEQGAAACALEMAKAKAINEAQKTLRGNFLEGVLAGVMPQIETDRLSSRLDHDTQPPHVVLAIAWVGGVERTIRRIDTVVNWLVAETNEPALVHIFGGKHVSVFLAVGDNEKVDSAEALAKKITDHLQAEYADSDLVVGVSRPALGIAEWPERHREAAQALNIGRHLKQKGVVLYAKLGVFQLLGQLENIPAVIQFSQDVLGPLIEYDQNHQGHFLETLAAFFEYNGNITKAAEALFVHRNTLIYRLERIEVLSGFEFANVNMRLALHLALRLWQLRGES